MRFRKFKFGSHFRDLEDTMDDLKQFMDDSWKWAGSIRKEVMEDSPLVEDCDGCVKSKEFYSLVAKFNVLQRELNEQRAITLALHNLLKEVVKFVREKKA